MALAPTQSLVETPSRAYYRQAMETLTRAQVPFLVGGTFAFVHQAGIDRSTKDLDIFVRPGDVHRLLEVCAAAGYEAELVFSHWLAKIRSPDGFIDVIFSSGNGEASVDDEWFANAERAEVLGLPLAVCPAEEAVWSKAFVMERERYDGADIVHIIFACAERLDWARLVRRFGERWRVLLSHLILFGFAFPSERARIPLTVMDGLIARLLSEAEPPRQPLRVCNGTLLSWSQYLGDIDRLGMLDGRLPPQGRMTPEEIAAWTAADKR